jgi:uncharacterized repeat protein (TIGR04076 family)
MGNNAKWAHDLEITLIKGEGVCAAGHRVGDQWIWSGDGEQLDLGKGMCVHALGSMLPKLVAMRYGASLPWLKSDQHTSTHLCPDVANPHVFRIQRIERDD